MYIIYVLIFNILNNIILFYTINIYIYIKLILSNIVFNYN